MTRVERLFRDGTGYTFDSLFMELVNMQNEDSSCQRDIKHLGSVVDAQRNDEDRRLKKHDERLDKLEKRIKELEAAILNQHGEKDVVESLLDRVFQLENPPLFEYDDKVIIRSGGSVLNAPNFKRGRIIKFDGCRETDYGRELRRYSELCSVGYLTLPKYSDPYIRENRYTVECDGELYTVMEGNIKLFDHALWERMKPIEKEEVCE